jgi:glycosyltransferase involved in cell wall biosynthesis
LDLEWHAIGFGPDEKELKALIEAHALQDRFLLVGKKVNPYPCIRSCDIYVQPSRYEGKAVAVREAQTLGRPVVVRNFDTAHDQVRHGWDGIVSGHSAEELADSIEGLMEDEALMTKLSSNALATDYSNRDAVTKMLHDIDERTARR